MSKSVNVSVIMACYNSLPFLDEAIQSLLDQTERDWELIAVDDCSTDATLVRLNEWAALDSRIRVVRMPENGGAGAARDFALKQPLNGEYIAIFDGDDVSLPDRFRKQIAYLQSHSDVVALGTQADLINEKGDLVGTKTFPIAADALYQLMYTAIPIQLPSLMVNRKLLPADFDWFEGWRYSEDTLLFFKLAHYGKLANLAESYILYRSYPDSTSSRHAKRYFYQTWEGRKLACEKWGYKPTLRARLISILQYLVVSCIPASWLPQLYKRVRKIMLLFSGHA